MTIILLLFSSALLLIFGIFCGAYLFHNTVLGWATIVIVYAVLATMALWQGRLFRWLYLRPRLKRIQKIRTRKEEGHIDEDDDTETTWFSKYSDVLMGVGLVILITVVISGIYSMDTTIPTWLKDSVKNPWFWAAVALLAFGIPSLVWLFRRQNRNEFPWATLSSIVMAFLLGLFVYNAFTQNKRSPQAVLKPSTERTNTSSNNSSAVQTKSSPGFRTYLQVNHSYDFKTGNTLFVWNRQLDPTFFSPVQRGTTIKILQQNIAHPSIHWTYYAVRGMDGKVTDWIDTGETNTDNGDPGMYRAILQTEDAEISISNDPEKR